MELYLTAGGLVGDDVPPGGDVLDQVIFSSTGGFSNVFPIPDYQKAAVESYMEKYAPHYPGQYNNSGVVRGKLESIAPFMRSRPIRTMKLMQTSNKDSLILPPTARGLASPFLANFHKSLGLVVQLQQLHLSSP